MKDIKIFFYFSPIYPSSRYTGSITNNNLGTTLTISDSDNRDPISSAILKATSNQSYRGKSPVTNATPLPTHSYYTRSKSVILGFFFPLLYLLLILQTFLFSLIPNIKMHQERKREREKLKKKRFIILQCNLSPSLTHIHFFFLCQIVCFSFSFSMRIAFLFSIRFVFLFFL